MAGNGQSVIRLSHWSVHWSVVSGPFSQKSPSSFLCVIHSVIERKEMADSGEQSHPEIEREREEVQGRDIVVASSADNGHFNWVHYLIGPLLGSTYCASDRTLVCCCCRTHHQGHHKDTRWRVFPYSIAHKITGPASLHCTVRAKSATKWTAHCRAISAIDCRTGPIAVACQRECPNIASSQSTVGGCVLCSHFLRSLR